MKLIFLTKAAIILSVIMIMNSNGAQAQKRIFTAEDLFKVQRISEVHVSPDGNKLLYKISLPDIKENKMTNALWVSSIDGSNAVKVSADGENCSNGIWSPDGKQIAYIAPKDGTPQIFIMDYPGGTPRQVGDIKEGASCMAFSPDGKYFSFSTEVKVGESLSDLYPQYDKANMKIFTTIPIRHWDEWVTEKYPHLFIMKTDGSGMKDLMPGEKFECPVKPFGGGEEIAWSPDSKEIAYTSKKVNNYAQSTNLDVFLYSLETGKTVNITSQLPGSDRAPLYSPDGKWIAFHSQQRPGFESDRIRLMLYDRKAGNLSELSKTLDQWVEETIWAPDSKSLFLTATFKGTMQVFNMKLNGEWKNITSGDYVFQNIDVTPDGKSIICCRQDVTNPFEIYSMPVGGGDLKRISHLTDDFMSQFKSSKTEGRWITSTDGAKVFCWVIYPPDFDPSKKYPVLTFCQGGPQSPVMPQFHYRWNYFVEASQGYIVLAPNRRGVPGFGQDWNDAISKHWGGQAMSDIMAATDELAKEPYVDKNRIAAIGASAGGFTTFWLEGHNENGLYCALVSHAGVFDLVSMYGSTEELWFPDWEYGGPYWKDNNMDNYAKNSPHMFAANWKTPIFISTGGRDFRVPFTQSLEAYTVAQVNGVPSELIYFPEETHFIAKPQNSIIWHNELFKFLDKYCKSR